MATTRFIQSTTCNISKLKHQISGRRAVLEEYVQPIVRQELDPDVLKSPLLDGHIIHVPKHGLTRR